jgi:hypothetical protein
LQKNTCEVDRFEYVFPLEHRYDLRFLKRTAKISGDKMKMSTNFTIAIALAVTISGCAAVAPAGGNQYTSRDGKLNIRGELVDSSSVRIFVNGDKVIADEVSLVTGDGRFDGSWQGKPVSANCVTAAGGRLGTTTCTVAVAGERVTLAL